MADYDWKIYYDDGTIFTNEDGEWKDAPLDGVQFIVQLLPGDMAVMLHGHDYYTMIGDTIVETDDLGPLLRKARDHKFGRSTNISNFQKIQERAVKDMKKAQIARRKE